MNCLYITLFFNIVAGIVQTFIESWNQLLYPRVIEFCRLPFELRHDFLHSINVVEHPSENSRHYFVTVCRCIDGFGGLVVSTLASGSRVCGFEPDRNRWIFFDVKKSSACLPSEGK
jgi:hypothetical protein